MNLRKIQDTELEDKKVLLRVGFDVKVKDGKLGETFRILAAHGSISHIMEKEGAKLALLSYLGRPQGIDKNFSYGNIYHEIGKILGKELVFVDDCIGEKVKNELDNLAKGQILMLENVRFYKEENENNADFARKLGENFDIFISDAFSQSHRDQASVTGITKFISSFAGLNLQKEIGELDKARGSFEKPAVAIIGGAKIETKLPVIEFFAKIYDWVLVGSKLSLEAAKGNIKFAPNVILTEDYRGDGLDIGEKTEKNFALFIGKAKYILWNGPLGKFEEPEFNLGTEKILKSILANKGAYKIAGGGETLEVLEKGNYIKDFNFVSTGGGAMLDYLVGKKMPGIEALQSKS